MQKGRLHVFLRFTAGGHHGWTELNATRAIPTEKVPGFINSQLKWYGELKGLTVADALKAVVARRPKGVREMEVAEMALLDLAGRLAGKPTIELLGLTGKDPVPGVFCILSDDPAEVEKLAKLALEQKLSTHMKVIFNMHPACMGSVMETVTLGHLIQSWERKLMVGDSSLVGPACPAWTQMAIGLGADWVEAIEKPQENDVFQRCLLKNAVGRTPDGRFHIRESLPGWGIEIDEAKLRELAAAVVEL